MPIGARVLELLRNAGTSAWLALTGRPSATAALEDLRKPISTSGAPMLGGRSWIERNRRLAGRAWPFVADEMLRTDGMLYGAWRQLSAAMLSEEWVFEPAADSATARRYADFANEAFGLDGKVGRLRGGFEAGIKHFVSAVPLGFAYAETVFSIEDGKVWLGELAPCEQLAHDRWVTSPDGRTLAGLVQSSFGAMGQIEVPAEKIALMVHDGRAGRFDGTPTLRPCYPWQQLKEHCRDLIATGSERLAVGVPSLEVDRRVAIELGYNPAEIAVMIEEAKRALAEFGGGRSSWLISNPATKLGILGGGNAFRPEALLSVIQVCDVQMLVAWLTQFLTLGLGEVGARNIGEVHQLAFNQAAANHNDSIRDMLCGAMGPGRGVVERLLRWNFPRFRRELMPKLVHTGLRVPPLMEVLSHLPHLVNSGIVTPEDKLEEALRRIVGAVMPDDARRSAAERLRVPNNTVKNPGPAITPDGAPAAPPMRGAWSEQEAA